MGLTATGTLEARRAGRRRRKGWAAAGPQRPAFSGLGNIVSPRAQLVVHCSGDGIRNILLTVFLPLEAQ